MLYYIRTKDGTVSQRKEMMVMPWLPSVVWLVLLVVFVIVEAVTVGLASVWFAAGALVALLATFFTDNIWLQIFLFVLVSAVTLAALRPLAKKYVSPQHVATNADRVIGMDAVVVEDIDDLAAAGAVKVMGTVWTARSSSGAPIPAGSTVTVDRIDGVKLFVTVKPNA